MSNFAGLYDIRDMVETDKNFILATFLRGLYYWDGSDENPNHVFTNWFSLIPKDTFMDNYKLIAQALISSPKVAVKVACLKEDQDVILGYSILSSDFQTIHWVYVKTGKDKSTSWRNKGIGRSLVPQYPTKVTHLTKLGHRLMNKIPTASFNPFA